MREVFTCGKLPYGQLKNTQLCLERVPCVIIGNFASLQQEGFNALFYRFFFGSEIEKGFVIEHIVYCLDSSPRFLFFF